MSYKFMNPTHMRVVNNQPDSTHPESSQVMSRVGRVGLTSLTSVSCSPLRRLRP